jgi:hypothetical protein
VLSLVSKTESNDKQMLHLELDGAVVIDFIEQDWL